VSGRRLSPGEDAAIREAYDGGLSVRRCAAKFGHVPETITRAIIRDGGTLRGPGELPAVLARRVRAAYEASVSARETGARFGLGQAAVARAVVQAGGAMRSRGPAPGRGSRVTDVPRLLARYCADGWSVGPCAADQQVSYRAARAALVAEGVTIRQGPRKLGG
jgi:hypothetical protein